MGKCQDTNKRSIGSFYHKAFSYELFQKYSLNFLDFLGMLTLHFKEENCSLWYWIFGVESVALNPVYAFEVCILGWDFFLVYTEQIFKKKPRIFMQQYVANNNPCITFT